MAELDVSVEFGFALTGILYKSTQGWGWDVLGHPLGISAPEMRLGFFTKANSSFGGTASIRTRWEHPQEGLNPWKTKDSP